ncbi:MAG: hypothetical protein AAB316_05465, partial [Bacteroidota bacterium]
MSLKNPGKADARNPPPFRQAQWGKRARRFQGANVNYRKAFFREWQAAELPLFRRKNKRGQAAAANGKKSDKA